jgi:spermidine/putrescine transport system ATP-binding protein
VLTAVASPTGETATAPRIASIELRGVEKTYAPARDGVAAVRGIDLRIEDGEFFSLLGPSGCGKSTTLRMIAGFEQPTAGEVLLHGERVNGTGPDRRDVNMVFQNYALFPHLNVWDNVAFGLRRRHVPKAEITARVREMLRVVELDGKERSASRALSGGQQQRVALARALVNRPKALLLDEPLGALDMQLRQTMQVELKRIQREVGVTFVYVTHDQSEALTMSDRIAVMRDGGIEQCGDPRAIYERPATPFVAQFIGTSNLFDVTVDRLAGDRLVCEVSADERIVAPPIDGITAGGGVRVSVRPEHITMTAEPAGDASRLRGTITEIVYLGSSITFVVRTAALDRVVVLDRALQDAPTYARGQDVWLSWPTATVSTFPSA